MTITVGKGQWCGFPQLVMWNYDVRPSWKRYGTGTNDIEFTFCPVGDKWLSINATERCESSHRRTMVTLNYARAVALRDFLVENVK